MMMSIQPAFSFDLAKMRYLDNTLGGSYGSKLGRNELTEAEANIISEDLRVLQNQLSQAQRALTDMFQTFRSSKTKPF